MMGEHFGFPRIGAERVETCQIETGLASADWTKSKLLKIGEDWRISLDERVSDSARSVCYG